jgi:hypothetical protein
MKKKAKQFLDIQSKRTKQFMKKKANAHTQLDVVGIQIHVLGHRPHKGKLNIKKGLLRLHVCHRLWVVHVHFHLCFRASPRVDQALREVPGILSCLPLVPPTDVISSGEGCIYDDILHKP